MTVDKTGKVQAAQVDVQQKTKKTEEKPKKVEVDMTGGVKPQSQNPLDFIDSLTGKKKSQYSPEMQAILDKAQKAAEEERAKMAKMTPQERAEYEKKQDAELMATMKRLDARNKRENSALGKWIQGWKDDFAPVGDAKGVAGKAGAIADAVVGRTRRGFASMDAVIGLPQGTTEKVWAGAAAVATGAYVAEALGGTAGLAATAKTVLSSPGTKALAAVGTVASPMAMTSCTDDILDETHNYEIELPRDTITEYKEITLPPETITVVKHDTIKEPVMVHDTTYIDKIIHDTTYVDKVVHDTVTIKVPEIHTDTIKVPEIHTDTLYLPGEVVHDTIKVEVPGPVVTVPEEWESPIPDKQKEILDELGVSVDKNGKFVLSTNYYDEYNYTLNMKNINGGKSSRDGSMIVYDEIKTEWGDNGLKLGQNEAFRRYQYTLSNDGQNLTIRQFKPRNNPSVSNESGTPNWNVFKNQLKDDTQWVDAGVITLSSENGSVRITGTSVDTDGELSPGDIENSVMYTNPYQGQWRLSDWKVRTGDAQ